MSRSEYNGKMGNVNSSLIKETKKFCLITIRRRIPVTSSPEVFVMMSL